MDRLRGKWGWEWGLLGVGCKKPAGQVMKQLRQMWIGAQGGRELWSEAS